MRSNGPFQERTSYQTQKFLQNWKLSMRTNFDAREFIFSSEKTQDVYFELEKFLPQPEVFYPLLYWCTTMKLRISIWILDIHTTMEGVKNFERVKNFWFSDKFDSQILPEEKIESLENSLFCVEKKSGNSYNFWNQNGRYPLRTVLVHTFFVYYETRTHKINFLWDISNEFEDT